MLTLDEALGRLLGRVSAPEPSRAESVSTFDALRRVLAADVVSLIDVPPQDNSEMDGYAMRSVDVPAAGTVLPVSQRIPAGVIGRALLPATAARIFTGRQPRRERRAAQRRRRPGPGGDRPGRRPGLS